ncbi:hypothetical protein CANARDRAFT_6089 [[Candida] arabinofermentans NRRL YB-2248]|uniref:uS12 prolyl 3,4-dihydroxylase n=1 Tax=[Candida] arabinofermentans NRRL YB-2248 TaxID=983967 RepID=A0A1E4T746_9ASCO|nr:hypothetical protein CANARDRAFT_6089 [[Candida] arabinofermentans NRRL YB-2248]
MPEIKKRSNSEDTQPLKRSNQKKPDSSSSNQPKITIKQTEEEELKAKDYFQSHIFDNEFKNNLKDSIIDSKPFQWGTITNLIDESLLKNVRVEIMNEIKFTKKETDIYKVYQTGDLANLSGMSKEDLKRLPNLYKLRSAIYSKTFRDYISYITGCDRLSGLKTDMSINTYTKSCHLLTHDDVIGSRRVSFILYLPEPGKVWKPHYGGSLRLFDKIVPNVPKSDPYCKLTPQFNQIAFFKVQPGLSFHDVEEVKVDKQRLSIQGWFHIPQFGEDGYKEGEQELTEAKSTLQQLESKELREFDFPKVNFTRVLNNINDESFLKLNDFDISYLNKFMNSQLTSFKTMSNLSEIFINESVIDIHNFLNLEYSSILQRNLKNFELNEFPKMPTIQEDIKYPWKLAIPSHKQRYMYIDGLQKQPILNESEIKITERQSLETPNFQIIQNLKEMTMSNMTKNENDDDDGVDDSLITIKLCELASFMRSLSFQKWLFQITNLKVLKDQIIIRRFRPGFDFILATKLNEDENGAGDGDFSCLDGVLEATLNLTPSKGWETGEFGGYELCMTNDDDDSDTDSDSDSDSNKETNKFNEDEAAIYKSSDKNDSVLYESQACWNKLNLMFRDENVLKFIKYTSFNSVGSRWDISGCWKCKDE